VHGGGGGLPGMKAACLRLLNHDGRHVHLFFWKYALVCCLRCHCQEASCRVMLPLEMVGSLAHASPSYHPTFCNTNNEPL
jgi:hypothetical protein